MYIQILFGHHLVIQENLFNVIIYCASIMHFWLLIQSAMNMEDSVWIYGYYIMEIFNILIDGLTPCC
jgi:hypothetical protein